ncbi:hypothetical protein SFRURICE_017549 [Spodoptera frugiperda]|nr:hypothetical protein SFRURICE_017549 [Spodoptera frugiperda]
MQSVSASSLRALYHSSINKSTSDKLFNTLNTVVVTVWPQHKEKAESGKERITPAAAGETSAFGDRVTISSRHKCRCTDCQHGLLPARSEPDPPPLKESSNHHRWGSVGLISEQELPNGLPRTRLEEQE